MPIYTAVIKNAQCSWALPAPQRKPVLSVEIKPSYRCNQNCVMCPYDKNSGAPMTGDEILRNLDFVRDEFDFEEFVLSGGEPTLRPDFFTILGYAAQHFPDKKLTIHTNAIRFAERSFAARLPVRAGVRAFVSLHAPDEDTNRRITSVPGSHERILQGIRNLKERGVEVSTDTVLLSLNQHRLKEIGSLLLELGVASAEIRLPHVLQKGTDFFSAKENKSVPFWVPDFRFLESQWKEMLVHMSRGGFQGVVVLANKPPCLLKGIGTDEEMGTDVIFRQENKSVPISSPHRAFIDKTHQLEHHGLGDDYESSIDDRFYAARIKLEPCRECMKSSACKGVTPEFLKNGFTMKPTQKRGLMLFSSKENKSVPFSLSTGDP